MTLLLLIPVVSAVMSASGIDTWYMLNDASTAITNSIPEYVSETNQAMVDLGGILGVDTSGMMVEPADCVKSGGSMLGWGVVTLLLSCIAFVRREF